MQSQRRKWQKKEETTEGRELNGTNLHPFQKQSTLTITSAYPCDTGRYVMKSTATCDDGLSGVVRGINFLADSCFETLVMTQTEHDWSTTAVTLSVILGHQYFFGKGWTGF